jgi:hypothetical protein
MTPVCHGAFSPFHLDELHRCTDESGALERAWLPALTEARKRAIVPWDALEFGHTVMVEYVTARPVSTLLTGKLDSSNAHDALPVSKRARNSA